MSDLKGLIIAAEAVVLLVLGAANIVSGQFLGAAILIGISLLAAALVVAQPRRAGSSRRPRH